MAYRERRDIWIDHAVSITVTAGCTVMYLAGIDQIEMTGAGALRRALDGRNLRAVFDGADGKCIMGMRRKLMCQERRGHAFHAFETLVPPEPGGFCA